MERLKLVQGLSYSYGDIVATKAHPFVEVKEPEVANYLVRTGFFVPIDFDSSSAKGVPAHETEKRDPEDTVMMPAPTSKAPEKKASPLDKMTVEELRQSRRRPSSRSSGRQRRKLLKR